MLILKKTFTLGFLSGILLAYVILPLFLYSFLPLFTDKGLESGNVGPEGVTVLDYLGHGRQVGKR